VSQVFAATIELTLARTLVHDENIGSMAFSPDGSMIASCGVDITLWSIATGTVVRTIEVMGGPHAGSVAISPDGSLIVGGEEHVTVWDMTTGREVYTLEAWKTDIKTGLAGGTVLSKAFSPDGKLLALGHINYVIGIWDVATGGLVRTLRGETLAVRSVAFSPDGRLLASGTRSSTIRLWEVATGRLVRTLTFREDTGVVTTVAFSPDGSLLASGGSESWKSGEGYDRGLIRFHDVTTGRELRTIEGDPEQIMSIAFSLDGRLLASGGSYYWDEANRIRRAEIKLWDVTTGHLVRTLQGHTGDIRSLVFSPDGRLLASGSNDRTIKLWDLSDLTGQGS
jgi:WD40 repeat protein